MSELNKVSKRLFSLNITLFRELCVDLWLRVDVETSIKDEITLSTTMEKKTKTFNHFASKQ